jgi:hypothetical protein
VFVRIGKMPQSAWAAPSVARLRGWHWNFMGMGIDSTRVLTEGTTPAAPSWSSVIPVELHLTLMFDGDTAWVVEELVFQTCRLNPHSFHSVWTTGHRLVRSDSGWRASGEQDGGMADALCR